jgi:hypothetical protein
MLTRSLPGCMSGARVLTSRLAARRVRVRVRVCVCVCVCRYVEAVQALFEQHVTATTRPNHRLVIV